MDPKLEEIVAGLRAGGEMADTGYFTLDHEAARQKLDEFQLADTAACLARLVEMAGRLGGAVTVLPSHHGISVMLHRVHLSRWEAEGAMMVGLVVPRTEREAALRDLSLAMRAMAARARGAIHLVSNDGKGTYRCAFEGVARGKVTALSGGVRVTTVHLPLRRLALPLRWANPWRGEEVTRLRERVRWARTDVAYGQKPLSFGLPTHLEATVHDRIDDADAVMGVDWAFLEPRRGDAPTSVFDPQLSEEGAAASVGVQRWRASAEADLAALYRRYASLEDGGTLHVLVRGVHLERLPLPHLPAGVVAVLDVSDAQRDLAAARIQRDDRFDHRVDELQRDAVTRLRARIDERLEALASDGRASRRERALARVKRQLEA